MWRQQLWVGWMWVWERVLRMTSADLCEVGTGKQEFVCLFLGVLGLRRYYRSGLWRGLWALLSVKETSANIFTLYWVLEKGIRAQSGTKELESFYQRSRTFITFIHQSSFQILKVSSMDFHYWGHKETKDRGSVGRDVKELVEKDLRI